MMNISAIDKWSNEDKSRFITVILHALLLLLAIWPLMKAVEWEEPVGVTVEFTPLTQHSETKSRSSNTNGSASSPRPDQPPKAMTTTSMDLDRKNSVSQVEVDRPVIVDHSESLVLNENSSSNETPGRASHKEGNKPRDFSSLFGTGSTTGSSTSSPNGDGPDLSSSLKTYAEGLENRRVIYQPKISDHSQKTGRVNIKVCVNAEGHVVSATYTQRGSTTTDEHLVKLAETSAIEWKFSPATLDRQCGLIRIDFQLE